MPHKCIVEGCNSNGDGRGKVCGKHQRRKKLYGDYNITKNRTPGGGFIDCNGYVGHQINGKKKFEHVRIAESVLGRPLPINAVVHHANCDKTDNRKENLVICPDRAYHNLLHARIDALNETGDPSKRKCRFCHCYDSLDNMSSCKSGKTTAYWHTGCHNKYQNKRRMKNAVL